MSLSSLCVYSIMLCCLEKTVRSWKEGGGREGGREEKKGTEIEEEEKVITREISS